MGPSLDSYTVDTPQPTKEANPWPPCRLTKVLCLKVTLECPGNEEVPRVDKLVERILHCSCQSCSKEAGQEGALLQLDPSEVVPEAPPSPPIDDEVAHPHALAESHARAQPQHSHTHTDAGQHIHTPVGG